MVTRELRLPSRSFFLFGPRQTGKSTWLAQLDLGKAWTVNLLRNDTYYRYLRDPSQFRREADAKIADDIEWIVLDEVQRIPALLDEVQDLMERHPVRFILSGSSARKLKRGGANLLGGRALMCRMHPFTARELGDSFDLERTLQTGSLPSIFGMTQAEARRALNAYVEVYLREEIQIEGLVRNLGGFTRFLDLAGAYCGEILNFSSLAKEAGLPIKTVQSYFEVLEDTLVAVRLPAWTKSPLKRLVSHPKFYLFDCGVTNALTHRLAEPLEPAVRGRLFEQFIVLETRRLIDYSEADADLHYWRSSHGAEVDLLVEINGRPALAVELKSRPRVDGADLGGLRSFRDDWPDVPCLVVCTAPEAFKLDFAEVLPWRLFFERLGALFG